MDQLMFVKKLVEKAVKPGGSSDGIKAGEVEPRLVFHYGIPPGSTMFAYDAIQDILALSTKDGRVKLFGKDNSQALLQSQEAVSSKFLLFTENEGYLLNVTSTNHLEVWDVSKKLLSHVHIFNEDITSFTLLQRTSYIFVGDSVGNISVLKLEQEPCNIVQMQYKIPLSASRGNPAEVSGDTSVAHMLPQPTAEHSRLLLIYKDGLINLWELQESKSIFTTGGNTISMYQEGRKVTSACWVCNLGSKLAVGYSNGEILIWGIPTPQNSKTGSSLEDGTQTAPLFKLNLGYKSEKVPIASLKWACADGKASRLYAIGASNLESAASLQVVLLNEHTESRSIKMGLQLPEPCIDMEIISSFSEQSRQKQDYLALLGKSGHVYTYDDCLIEKFLLQSQARSPLSFPKEVTVKMPFVDSTITAAIFIRNNRILAVKDEDYILLAKSMPPLFAMETKSKDGNHISPAQFSGFSKVENLYITGHSNGAVTIWDSSCPIFIPVLSLQQQSEHDFTLSGIAVTALYFDRESRMLFVGDQGGMVRIFRFRPDPYAAENNLLPFQGNTKKRNNHIVHSVSLVKIDGSIHAMHISHDSRHLAVGSDKGYVAVIDIQGANIMYQKQISSELCSGIVSAQFESCRLHGFEKNLLMIATKDSSLLALDSDTGSPLSTSMIQPKKPFRALFMQILGSETGYGGSSTSDCVDLGKGGPVVDGTTRQPLILLCSEKAAYVYSLVHATQGVKKVHYKKKFQSSSCCWASTFYSDSNVGLMLLFNTGKLEIRSLPELSLIKETSLRGFLYSTSKPNSIPDTSICASREGDLVVVNGDQEIFAISVLLRENIFRILDEVSRIYRKDLIISQGGPNGARVHKEKKKGIFGSVFKDITGSKAKNVPDVEAEDTRECGEELSTIFSTVNFHCNAESSENKESLAEDEDENELDIDDIDLEDPVAKPQEHNILASLNKQKLASKFTALKGKLKQMKVKSEKNPTKEEQPDRNSDDKAGAVDQIRRKYGFSSSSEIGAAKMAESKLQENLRKLQGINQRAADMQDTAKSFSSMASELLKTAEHGRRNS